MGHLSISCLKRNSSIKSFSCGNEICLNTNGILKLLREIDTKKSVGFDMIPPKLVKIAVHVLCSPLCKDIYNSRLEGLFPDDTEIALVFSLDKGTSKKNKTSNFRPASILPTFSEIYEKVAKKFLEADINKLFSLFSRLQAEL